MRRVGSPFLLFVEDDVIFEYINAIEHDRFAMRNDGFPVGFARRTDGCDHKLKVNRVVVGNNIKPIVLAICTRMMVNAVLYAFFREDEQSESLQWGDWH